MPAVRLLELVVPVRLTTNVLLLSNDGFAPSWEFLQLRRNGSTPFSHGVARLDRAGQPTDAQSDGLEALGVNTTVSLRDEASGRASGERTSAAAFVLRFVRVPLFALSPVKEEVKVRVLSTLREQASGNVYIHCHIGCDSTS